MRSEHLSEIVMMSYPGDNKLVATKKFANEINRFVSEDMQRSDRTLEAYCSSQRKIPMEYAATVIGYIRQHREDVYRAVAPKIENEPVSHLYPQAGSADLLQVVAKMEKTIDKLQAATQSTGMLMAIRAMCEDCAGGPASDPQNVCWWKNCPLREFSDMRLADNAKSMK